MKFPGTRETLGYPGKGSKDHRPTWLDDYRYVEGAAKPGE